ncbi:hypothetical protein HUJ04_010864 [Dendroctonus ponderosae]|nr:hypothetical protein HUJ04_010864 [Dendroctonus ponderosae]
MEYGYEKVSTPISCERNLQDQPKAEEQRIVKENVQELTYLLLDMMSQDSGREYQIKEGNMLELLEKQESALREMRREIQGLWIIVEEDCKHLQKAPLNRALQKPAGQRKAGNPTAACQAKKEYKNERTKGQNMDLRRRLKEKHITLVEIPEGQQARDTIQTFLVKKEIVYINWVPCYIQEEIGITICHNCNRFGHAAKKCSATAQFHFCGQPHERGQCAQKHPDCLNCKSSGFEPKDRQHSARDRKCPIYRRKELQHQQTSINYGQSKGGTTSAGPSSMKDGQK